MLIVDDEADIRELLDLTMVRMGVATDCAANLAEARGFLERGAYQLCLTDMRLPDGDGLSLVRHIGETCPQMPVAVITAHGSTENAVAALKAGAFDYLSKPVSLDQLRALVKTAIGLPSTEATSVANAALAGADNLALLGSSAAMAEVRNMIERVARSQAPVHIQGESGSGKELAARLIHQLGARGGGPFVPVNCGAIPENLMESEFFGYRKGAFTGAEQDRDGFFQVAHGGTLFLDEVADLPAAMQVKLLRVIQEKKLRKVGSPTEDAVDVRILSATHQNLRALVDQGKFRQDLYFRLNVIELRMPSLRECGDDVLMLAERILARLARESGTVAPALSSEAKDALAVYSFPGNVRELENILERAMALRDGDRVEAADLNLAPAASANNGEEPAMQNSLQDYLDQVERQALLEALQKTRFNRTAAAKLLGVTFRSLRYRMERLGLND
ncbi:MAG: sigma-54-dependent Fis family transcriptional regulator [Rhodocyclaceae bacterium]|nr:MAG: sigma-54-dependent Fis family transcriptional regulator [Rhodocyclaceae bacterium]